MSSGAGAERGEQVAGAADGGPGLAPEGDHLGTVEAVGTAPRAQRARPAAVRAPVLLPPWKRQRPLAMVGWRQQPAARVFAPQRGAFI